LITLVDKSLLEHSDGTPVRFRMLETIREYGVEQLAGRSELGTARSRHADYFHRLVIDIEPRLRGPEQSAARVIIERERDNILAALRYLVDSGEPHRALITVLGMTWYYVQRDAENELGYWLDQVIAANEGLDEPLLVYAEAARFLSDQRWLYAGDVDQLRDALADLVAKLGEAPDPPFAGLAVLATRLRIFLGGVEDMDLDELIGKATTETDPWIRGAIFSMAAWMAENAGDRQRMGEYSERAYQDFSRTGDSWGLAAALSQQAQLLTLEGKVDEAVDALQRTLELSRVMGSVDDMIIGHLRICMLQLRRGDTTAARRHLELMRTAQSSGTMERERVLMCGCAESAVLLAEGRHADAGALVSRMRDGLDRELLENRFSAHASAMALACCAAVELELARRAEPAERARRIRTARADLTTGYPAALLTEDVPIIAEFGTVVADAAESVGNAGRAALLLGAATGMSGVSNITEPRHLQLQDRLRAQLGADHYQQCFDSGGRLTRDQILTELDPDRIDH
jgi:hypothetical protein